jgi:hypothetical protein
LGGGARGTRTIPTIFLLNSFWSKKFPEQNYWLEELFSSCVAVSVFWLGQEIVFGVTYVLRVQYKMARRNRYLVGMEDGQMTPREYPNFDFYIKKHHVF